MHRVERRKEAVMNFPQQAWCPVCGQEGTLVTENTDVAGRSVAQRIFHPMCHFSVRRGGAENARRHPHMPHWGDFITAYPAGHYFVFRQSYGSLCWCGWPEISSADRME